LSCATARLPVAASDSAPAARSEEEESKYQVVLARYTQSRAVYDNFDTRMFVRATWQSPEFVEARARREAHFRALPVPEEEAVVSKALEQGASSTSFFMSVYVTDYRTDDFEKPNSMWRLVVVSNTGAEARPTSVIRLGRSMPEMRATYSYMEQFWVGYWVTFPKQSGPMTLRLASALGQADLPF
jgi:hypothetical protein